MSDPSEAVTDDAAGLAAEATGGDAADAASATKDAAEAAAADGESKGFVGAMLHTDPDANPERVDGPAWAGEFIVGGRKVIDAMGIEAGDGDGTPAVVNFYRGAMKFRDWLAEKSGEGSGDGDGDGDAPGDDASGNPEVEIRGA